jgi:hypothetical protein
LSAFTCYFDAGGKEADQVALSVAGFVATAEQWIEWERPWRERLAEDNLTVFHYNELSAMAEDIRERLVEDLCLIIRNHVVRKTGAVVLTYDVKTYLPENVRHDWRIDSYALCGRTVAKEVAVWASRDACRIPELVYEDGDVGKGKLMDLLTDYGYPSPIFKWKNNRTNKKTGLPEVGAPPLEAADLLAYKMFDQARRLWYDTNNANLRDFSRIQPDLDMISGACGIIGPDRLRFLKDGLEQFESEIMTTNVKINT